jgi:hypothetical protein
MTRTAILLWLGYAVLLTAAVTAVSYARRRVEASLATPAAQAEWDAWRARTKELSEGNDPMKRRPAKAPEPPMLILFRDHFGAAVGSTVVAVTVFYWLFVFLIRGSLGTPAPAAAAENESPQSERRR